MTVLPTSKRVVKGLARSGSFVKQAPGAKDCVIATVATVTGLSYNQIANALDIPIDNGVPDAVALGDGIKWWKTVIPLYRLGWVATPVFTREHPEHKEENDWPNSDAIKCLIIGRKAIVSYIDDDKTVGAHSLAWNGKELIDCNDCLIVDIDSIIIIEALMLGKSLTSDG